MALTMASCSKQTRLTYPAAPEDGTVDLYYSTEVNDPYRPLENDTATETLEWVKAENAVTQDYLSQIPFRGRIRERLKELNNYQKIGMPSKENDGKYYFFKNDGLQNQSVLRTCLLSSLVLAVPVKPLADDVGNHTSCNRQQETYHFVHVLHPLPVAGM